MSVVIFVGSLYVFITPGFSLFIKTNESYTWLESLDACIRINMTLASQKSVLNTSLLSPSENEPYWIQELDITKMFPKENTSNAYNESHSIQINNDYLSYQCTVKENVCCGLQTNNDSDNLVRLRSFSQISSYLYGNITYRIGYVNYTSLLNDNSSTLIRCVLHYNGNIYSDDCSNKRRAICVKDELQTYAVSKLDRGLPRYVQQPSSTTEAGQKAENTLYTIIGASVGGIVVLGIVIFVCVVCLFRRRSYDPNQGHRSVHKKRKSDKMDMFDTYSEVADSIARPELSQDPSGDPDKPDIVQYSTPEDALKFAMTTETEECTIYSTIDPNKKMNKSKANTQNRNDVNVYQYLNVVNDANVYDTTNYQNEKVIILEPTYDHFTTESNART
ncbi:hypothetical protein ACJMK2_022281 [Sinanodonta woodiana]|uniref:Uncharacterized protein n=1 Tax=Sinanodonta woodiana TaxID=1069815 RepID=A0ABD3TK98_SINWO